MKFVDEKDFKVREGKGEVVYDEKLDKYGLLVNGVLFSFLTKEQANLLQKTLDDPACEKYFNSVGIGKEFLNMQPKAACYDDYERPTGEIDFSERRDIKGMKLKEFKFEDTTFEAPIEEQSKESFYDFKKRVVKQLMQDIDYLDDYIDTVAEVTGSSDETALDLINEWLADKELTDSCYVEDCNEVLTEAEKLEEANLLKKAIVALGILTTLGVSTLSANALKDKGDWKKSLDKCAKELTVEYGKGGEIPMSDYKQMVAAMQQADAEEVLEDLEKNGAGLGSRWFRNQQKCQDCVDSVLEDLGFTVVADDVKA